MQKNSKVFTVKVYPSSSKKKIEENNSLIKIYITASPEKGKANKEALEFLADYLGVKKSCLRIIKGKTSRNKTIVLEI